MKLGSHHTAESRKRCSEAQLKRFGVHGVGLGLAELRERTAENECPFCGDPIAVRIGKNGRPPMSCGDEICRAAYHRFYARDRRRKERERTDERR